MPMPNDFAVFILTNGRPDKVTTFNTLKTYGYTGKKYLIVDDLDSKRQNYIDKFGESVIVFDKKEIAKKFDTADNFDDMRSIVYARNACFEIAKKIGVKYFVELDDDYNEFFYRYDSELNYHPKPLKNVDTVFSAILDFYKSTNISSISLSQGGDWIGGAECSTWDGKVMLSRKCMNSFFCSTERPFNFVGRINEDVNTYTSMASTGLLMFTTNHVSLTQKQTQSNAGGMSELYLESGTYLKSFYSVIFSPSSVKVKPMGDRLGYRLHHSVSWDNAVPKILSESLKKSERVNG